LLFVATLLAVYLGSLTGILTRRLGVPRGLGLVLALFGSILVVGLVGLLIVPPVVTQFKDLLEGLPSAVVEWERELSRLSQENQLLARILGPLGEVGQTAPQETPEGTPVGPFSIVFRAINEAAAETPREVLLFFNTIFQQVSQFFGGIVPYVFSGIGVLIHSVSVLIMGIYMALKPTIYREGLIAVTPPAYRELARDIQDDLGHTIRAWLVGLGMSMVVLGSLTWIGLVLLDVPYALAFGVVTGIAVIVPFFGTIVSTLLPALFVIGTGGITKALLVILLGVVVHLFEANVVAPMIFEKKIELPPVLTILAVLMMAELLGLVGLLVAVPVLASVMVLIRRIFVHRVLEGKGFHRIEKDAPAIISLPTGDGVLVHPSASETNIPALLEG
jgi:predicted PurR-regulated permease PerM